MFKKLLMVIAFFISSVGFSAPIKLTKDNTIVLRGEVDSKSVGSVVLKLAESDQKELYLFITSPGGSMVDGNQLVYALKNTDKKVTCIASVAASMAFIILQACHDRVILPHSILMQHVASYSLEGDAPNNASRVEFIQQMIDQLDADQAKRLGLSVKEFRAKTRNDWWLFGENAIKAKAADRSESVTCSEELAKERVKEVYQVFIFRIAVEWSACPLIEYPVSVGTDKDMDRIRKNPRSHKEYLKLLKSLDVRGSVNRWFEARHSK